MFKKYFVLALLLTVTASFCACDHAPAGPDLNYPTLSPGAYPQTSLSASCDYILCSGVDTAGNHYELVANQTETALDFDITVGIIKNNEWLCPLSGDFPFLGEDGLFHVSVDNAGKSGSSLDEVGAIRDSIYFIDTGGFLMEGYVESENWLKGYDHKMIFISCESMVYGNLDMDEYTILCLHWDISLTNDYGYVKTENGKILLYKEVSGTNSGWPDDWVLDWYLLDTKTLQKEAIATNVEGVYPVSALSEGLIFASDKCFYNTNMQKVIDISAYNIDMFYDGDLYFVDGICTFKASNSLGTVFLVTIDKSGNVIQTVQQ